MNAIHTIVGLSLILSTHNSSVTIQRVKTWAELEKQKSIKVSGGVSIKLGVSTRNVPYGSGLLLYCLTKDNFRFPKKLDQALGPIVVLKSKENHHGKAGVVIGSTREFKSRGKSWLFAFALKADQLGVHSRIICDQKGIPVAKITFRVTYEHFHPWSPIRSLLASRIRTAGIAFPFWNGRIAIPSPFNDWKKKAKRLPTYFPEKAAGLKVRIVNNKLLIRANPGLRGSHPEERFLARWWVNGKPVLFSLAPQKRFFRNPKGGGSIDLKKRLIPIASDLRLMNVGTKDRVSVQLLYCEQTFFHDKIPTSGRNLILISNKVTFTPKFLTKASR